MKKIIFLSFVFIFSISQAQNLPPRQVPGGLGNAPSENLNGLNNAAFSTLTGNENEWSKINGVGYNFDDIRFRKLGLDGSAYLFKGWDNRGVIEVGKKKYVFTNMNYHIYNDQFMSKLDNDSIFVINSTAIDKIRINNKSFRGIHDTNKGSNRMFEIIYESKDVSILKSYHVALVESSPNPMVNRPRPKIKRTTNYYTLKNGHLAPFKLKKSSILELTGPDAIKAEKFAKAHKLSFKKEQDIRNILQHISIE